LLRRRGTLSTTSRNIQVTFIHLPAALALFSCESVYGQENEPALTDPGPFNYHMLRDKRVALNELNLLNHVEASAAGLQPRTPSDEISTTEEYFE
ncbi:MAG: hypothetical protein AB7S46_04735, partial [Flavobacteriaceae bacterium]